MKTIDGLCTQYIVSARTVFLSIPPEKPGASGACASGGLNRSEGLDPNGICYPCVMGWGLAGTGNSSAATAAVVVVAPGGEIGSVFLNIV